MELNYLGEPKSVESSASDSQSPSRKRQRIDKSDFGEIGHSSKTVYFDANSENRDPRFCDCINEMGLAMIDTDDSSSNHSSSRNTIVSNQPSSVMPASAFSLEMNDQLADTLQSLSEDSEFDCQGTLLLATDDDSSIDNFSAMKHERSDRSDIMVDFMLSSDSSSSEIQTKSLNVMDNVQDNTPANLVPVMREFPRYGMNVTNSMENSLTTVTTSTSFRVCDCNAIQPEGRPIRNTSLVKVATNNSAQKHKGRSPLATVTCNSNHNSNNNSSINPGDSKKKIIETMNDESFFMYRREDPRIFIGDDNFEKLSDEMILSIFQWLPKKTLLRCCLVNHRFSRVSQDESLWVRLDLASKVLQPYALGRVLRRGVVILRLAQSKILEPIFQPFEPSAVKFMTKLQYLDLSMATITPQTLTDLLTHCSRLKKLSLEQVTLNDAVCKELANNKQLEVLNLAMCTGLTRYGVKKLMSSLKCLQSLNISWTSLESEHIAEFSNHVNENLSRLNIAGCRKTLTDDALIKIVQRCPKLCELDLSDCTLLTSQTIDIVCNLKHLEYLSLSRCYNINAYAYLEINKLVSLAFLDIFGVLSDQTLTDIKNNFPEIGINKFIHSAVARPTVGSRRTSIWGIRTRD